jgi:hypothetical protein
MPTSPMPSSASPIVICGSDPLEVPATPTAAMRVI